MKESPQDAKHPGDLSAQQLRARKRRNVAIGISIALLCVLFYAVTVAKLGSGVFNRPL